MVAEILVDTLVDDGRALLADLRRTGLDLAAAAWLHEPEYNRWHLYLVLPTPRGGKLDNALDHLYDALKRRPPSELRFDQVRFVWSDEPLGRALQTAATRWADRVSRSISRYQSSDLSLLGYDDAFVYPPTGQMTPTEMMRAFVGRMVGGPATVEHLKAKGEPVPTVTVVYKDGRSEEYHPVGLHAWGDIDPLDANSDPILHLKEINSHPDDEGADVHTIRLKEISAIL